MEKLHILIPKDVETIISILNENGHEAYAVGGCVRDSLLNREPMDWDITTSARPEEVKRLFHKTIDTGIAHGTVTVRMNNEGYEVTTYRVDGEYEDCRHPKSVSFTSKLSEDLLRRDFTINAMAYAPDVGIVDMYDGIKDLKDRIIRCVGNPEERFTEDALRTLRAVRFSGQLGFDIEENTMAAIKKLSHRIKNVSAERIRVEISKLILSAHADRLMLLYNTGLSKEFFPKWDIMMNTAQNNPHHKYSVAEHTIKVIEGINKMYIGDDERTRRILTWSALLHDVAKPVCKKTDEAGIDHFHGHPEEGSRLAGEILKRLKFDNYTISMVTRIIKYHDYRFDGDKRAVRRFVSRAGKDIMPYLFLIMEADLYGQSDYNRDIKHEKIMRGRRIVEEIIANKEPVSIKDLAVGGKELMEAGIPQGKKIGVVLEALIADVIDNPKHNNREYLLSLAKTIEI